MKSGWHVLLELGEELAHTPQQRGKVLLSDASYQLGINIAMLVSEEVTRRLDFAPGVARRRILDLGVSIGGECLGRFSNEA